MKITDKYELCRSEWEHLIDEWIFSEVHRQMIKRKILDGLGYEKLAEEFNVSCNTVKRIVKRCENELILHLKRYFFELFLGLS